MTTVNRSGLAHRAVPAINNSGPLARAIAYQPAVSLFDEPVSNLDARLRLEARTFLNRLPHELSVTTVFVTHDQAEEWPCVGGSEFHAYGSDALPGAPTTWVLTVGDDVLGVAAGHTAVSSDPTGPVLLRLGDELVALGADGLLLSGAGRRTPAGGGGPGVFRVADGPWWLEDDQMRDQALCG